MPVKGLCDGGNDLPVATVIGDPNRDNFLVSLTLAAEVRTGTNGRIFTTFDFGRAWDTQSLAEAGSGKELTVRSRRSLHRVHLSRDVTGPRVSCPAPARCYPSPYVQWRDHLLVGDVFAAVDKSQDDVAQGRQ